VSTTLKENAIKSEHISEEHVATLLHEFDSLDVSQEGTITKQEWVAFFERKHNEEGHEQGDNWDHWVIRHCLTLRLGSMSEKERRLYAAEKETLVLETHEDVQEVYALIASKHGGKVTKEACLDSQMKEALVNELKYSDAGDISIEAWNEFFQTRHAEMEKEHLLEGDRWLHNLMHAVRTSLLTAEEASRVSAERRSTMLALIQGTYMEMIKLIAPETDVLRKQDLSVAMAGNFHLFENIDCAGSGVVTALNFESFFMQRHYEKEHKHKRSGDKWVGAMMRMMQKNCKDETMPHRLALRHDFVAETHEQIEVDAPMSRTRAWFL